MGRINFGRAIKDFKGITESVELTINVDGRPFTCDLKDWEVFNLEDTCEFYKNMKFLNEKGERLSREPWIVKYADSEDVSRVNCSADKIFDLQESTYWSTIKGAEYPHGIVIDLGDTHTLTGIQCLPIMESEVPGGIKDFKVYVKEQAFTY